jgi:iron-sulfur cluster insertion protein
MSNEPSLHFTDNAAAKVFELIHEEKNPHLKLRVFINGGGCSGFQYGFTFDENVDPDDIVIEKTLSHSPIPSDIPPKVTLLVNGLVYQYLEGAKIDYRKDAYGEQFTINNPKAKTTCGCGSSFSIDKTPDMEHAAEAA